MLLWFAGEKTLLRAFTFFAPKYLTVIGSFPIPSDIEVICKVFHISNDLKDIITHIKQGENLDIIIDATHADAYTTGLLVSVGALLKQIKEIIFIDDHLNVRYLPLELTNLGETKLKILQLGNKKPLRGSIISEKLGVSVSAPYQHLSVLFKQDFLSKEQGFTLTLKGKAYAKILDLLFD